MRNDSIRIEEAGVWDILDWDVVARLSSGAPAEPTCQADVLPYAARRLIDASTKVVGRADEEVLHRIIPHWVGHGSAAQRRQRAGALAEAFGARPDRLIAFAAFKWGLFQR